MLHCYQRCYTDIASLYLLSLWMDIPLVNGAAHNPPYCTKPGSDRIGAGCGRGFCGNHDQERKSFLAVKLGRTI
jgi:hypothetical protein